MAVSPKVPNNRGKNGSETLLLDIPDDVSVPLPLLSEEKLDRSSPELWPEQIPGVSEFASIVSPPFAEAKTQPEWLKDLDQEDIGVLQGFGSLTAAALLEKVKDLQNLAYQLGLEEAKEMTRGKFLNILTRNGYRIR